MWKWLGYFLVNIGKIGQLFIYLSGHTGARQQQKIIIFDWLPLSKVFGQNGANFLPEIKQKVANEITTNLSRMKK